MKRLISVVLCVLLLMSVVFVGFTANADSNGGSNIVVVIDPGHGGIDGGSSNETYNVQERELNLKIAQYFKAELETYDGIDVYLTRNDNSDRSLGTGGDSLRKRAQIAADYGANLLVSVHCNSSTNKNVHGAEVYYPNDSSYEYMTHVWGGQIANAILSQLSNLGIYNRGALTRTGTPTVDFPEIERYPDESLADYYTIMIAARSHGITPLIAEHAFISNNSDYLNFLSTDEKLKNLGVADATAIAQYYNLHKKQAKSTDLESGTYVIVPATDKETVLDAVDNTSLTFNKENGKGTQFFNVTKLGNGNYKIELKDTNVSLNSENGNVLLSDTKNKEWTLLHDSNDNQFYYINADGGCITSDSGTLKIERRNGSQNQKFLFIPVSENVGNKSVLIVNMRDRNKVLEIAGDSKENEANCQVYAENHNDCQIFDIVYENGYYTIKNKNSDKVLDISNGSVNCFANVQQYASNGTVAQKWSLIKNADASYTFISRCNGLSIDLTDGSTANGANVQVYKPNGTTAQKFMLIDEKSADIPNGTYKLGTALNNGASVMDVANGSVEAGGNIWLYKDNGSAAQIYRIERAEFGYYKITSYKSGLSLDVENCEYADGANLWQYTYNGSIAQKWLIEKNEDSTYTIISRCNGKALDVTMGSTANGTNIQLYQRNGSLAQSFTAENVFTIPNELTRTADLTDGTYLITPMSDRQSVWTANGNTVETNPETGGENQLFDVSAVGDGTYKIINKKTGYSLTRKDGTAVLSEYSPDNANQKWTLNGLNNTEFYSIRIGEGFVTADNKSLKECEYSGKEDQKFLFVPISENIGDKSVLIASMLDKNKVLDIESASVQNGGNCQLYVENHTNAQIFNMIYKDGYYTIKNKNSGKVLEIADSNAGYFANVRQYEENGTAAQKWILVRYSNGSYGFISRCNGLSMDLTNGSSENFTNIQTYKPNGTNAQKFLLIDESSDDIPNGIYCLGTALNGGASVMDVANGSMTPGGNIWLYQKNNSFAQRYKFERIEFGYYKITSVKSGLALDVANCEYEDGANLWQYTYNGTIAQKWIIRKNDDGTYTIISRCNGKALDVSGGSTADGTNIQLWQRNNLSAQSFIIGGVYAIMDSQQATVDRMVQFYEQSTDYTYEQYLNSLGDRRSLAPATLREFCQMYCDEANYEGVKPEVAFCQAMHETGWLKYGGDVQPYQFNYAGIGAVGGGAVGAVFESTRIGIRAQIQHLKAYASTEDLRNECVDPRFKYVKRGIAPYVTDLSGKWAVPGTFYGANISSMLDTLIFG